jgi:hypothetical protein
MADIPKELAGYFKDSDFSNYPYVAVPQIFEDARGEIRNLADGTIGDVAIISSNSGAIRANHFHHDDWHLCYLVSGEMEYFWSTSLDDRKFQSTIVKSKEMVFTPARTPHKIVFNENSIFLSISKLSRISENYERDTFKLTEDFFKPH